MSIVTPKGPIEKQFKSVLQEFNGLIDEDNLLERLKTKLIPVGTPVPLLSEIPDTGYLLANGDAVSRGEYRNLFNKFGETFGPGDGVNTFNLPNMIGKMLMGASPAYPLGSTGGLAEVLLSAVECGVPAHTHTGTAVAHSHGVTLSGSTSSVGDHGHFINAVKWTSNNIHAHFGQGGYLSEAPNPNSGNANPAGTGGAGNHSHSVSLSGSTNSQAPAVTINQNTAADATSPHTNLPPYISVNWQIKY